MAPPSESIIIIIGSYHRYRQFPISVLWTVVVRLPSVYRLLRTFCCDQIRPEVVFDPRGCQTGSDDNILFGDADFVQLDC